MHLIDEYVDELASALHVRGRTRRRILDECRDHLVDAAEERGETEAVRAFGPATAIAAQLDAECATRRTLRATPLAAAGVILTGGSTLALIHAADPSVTAPTVWAIVFFVAAQLAATGAALACVQALAQRHATVSPAELALLSRRNLTALVASGVTMFAAGAALPGHGSALLLLSGPAVVCVALAAVLRARRLTRKLAGARASATHMPFDDIGTLLRIRVPQLPTAPLVALVTCLAAAAAFARDSAEHATAGGAAVTASIEALAVIGCFLVFGRTLGLWPQRTTSPSGA